MSELDSIGVMLGLLCISCIGLLGALLDTTRCVRKIEQDFAILLERLHAEGIDTTPLKPVKRTGDSRE